MTIGLILSGGGARAAYQVGVLRAVSEIVPVPRLNPFPVICGTSAGAINASLIACESNHFSDSVRQLESLWSTLSSEAVHELGASAVLGSLWRLFMSMVRSADEELREPWSLLDNSPLRELLARAINFAALDDRFVHGDLESLAISVLSYRDGRSLSFFESKRETPPWDRHRRVGLPTDLTLDHLMASAAIPGIYPAVRIGTQYYGDGAVRQTAPLSPALHLGATKLFVIGVSHNPKETLPALPLVVPDTPPSVANMTSHFLNGPFIDALEEDLESLLRFNEIVSALDANERARLELSYVDVMCIAPSIRFDEIAANHIKSLPPSMRFLMKTLGGTRAGHGASLASYLMFESPFIVELIQCGYDDAMQQRGEIESFLGNE